MRRKPKENNFKVYRNCLQFFGVLNFVIVSGFIDCIRKPTLFSSIQAVLETIRDLMNTECIVPDWLHDIFLGYDDPGAAHYSR